MQSVTPRQSTTVSRRTVTRTAAWSVPVIAATAAAPAFAASACSPTAAGSLDWSKNYTRTSTTAGTFTITVAGVGTNPAGGTLASTLTNYAAQSGSTTIPDNLGTLLGIGGMASTTGLALSQYLNPNSAGNAPATSNQTLTITFPRKVYNLAFVITDIDYGTSSVFKDSLTIAGKNGTTTNNSFTSTPADATAVGGSGVTTSDPIRSIQSTTNYANTQSNGNTQIQFTGALTSLTITYWNGLVPTSGTNNQYILLGPMSFLTTTSGTCP